MESGKIKNFNNLPPILAPLISTAPLCPHIVAPQRFAGIVAPNISTISIQKFPPWKRIFFAPLRGHGFVEMRGNLPKTRASPHNRRTRFYGKAGHGTICHLLALHHGFSRAPDYLAHAQGEITVRHVQPFLAGAPLADALHKAAAVQQVLRQLLQRVP